MGNFRNWLARLMYGRYGVDQLYFALIAAYLLLLIVNSFVRSTIINLLLWVLVIWMFYRVLSKDIYKRRMENEKFLQIWKSECFNDLPPHQRNQNPSLPQMPKLPYYASPAEKDREAYS